MSFKNTIDCNYRNLPEVFLILFCLFVSVVWQPPVLGLWESSVLFHVFEAEKTWINFLINPRACIGCYEYAALDLSRYVAQLFGLNMFSIRLLPALFGFASLYFLYKLLGLIISRVPALMTTALFAINPIFNIFQAQLNISIVTFFSFIFCVYGFYLVDTNKVNKNRVLIFAIACSIASLHYQIVRYCMISILLFWLSRGYTLKDKYNFNKLWLFQKEKNIYYLYFFLLFFLTLTLFHPLNIFNLINIEFLSPYNAEHARDLKSIFSSIYINLPKIFGLIVGVSAFSGEYSTDVIISMPYKILSLPLFIISIVGLISLPTSMSMRKAFFICMLLFLTIFPISLSLILPNGATTLNPYRVFYVIVPLYILIGVGINYFYKVRNYIFLTFLLFISFLTSQCYINFKEAHRFKEYIANFECAHALIQDVTKYTCKSQNDNVDIQLQSIDHRQLNRIETYENQIIPFWRYAGDLSIKIKEIEHIDSILIIDAPIEQFTYSPNNLMWGGYNLGKLWIALYLATNDIYLNYVTPYPGEGSYNLSQNGFGYLETKLFNYKEKAARRISTHINLPLKLDEVGRDYNLDRKYDTHLSIIKKKIEDKITQKENVLSQYKYKYFYNIFGKLKIFESDSMSEPGSHFNLYSTGIGSSDIYLATTNSEMEYILNQINKHDKPYKIIRI